jgi:hypothetical protein
MDGFVLENLLPTDIVKTGTDRQRILATWGQRVSGRP